MQNVNKKETSKRDPSKIYLPDFDESKLHPKRAIGNEPRRILEEIGVQKGYSVADFGSGIGYFVTKAAKMVGSSGRVIAIDIKKDFLARVKSKALENHLRNVYGVLTDLEKKNSTNLADDSIDLVLIINFLYLTKRKETVLKEALRVLKKGGRLVVMEWQEKGKLTLIDEDKVIPAKKLEEMTKKLGFKKVRSFEAGLSHEVNIFEKVVK